MRRLILLLLLAALSLGGCGGAPAVKKIVLTDEVDEQQAPVRTVTSFPEGARKFYLSALIANPVQGTQLKVRWRFNGHLVDEFELIMPDRRDRWAAFDLKAIKAFPSGQYQADLFLDNKLIQTVSFRVDPAE